MQTSMGWKSKTAAGIIGGLLGLGLAASAIRTPISPLLIGIGVGIVGAFTAAYLSAAVEGGLLPKSVGVRLFALLVLPPNRQCSLPRNQ